jgi:hypothetical protein
MSIEAVILLVAAAIITTMLTQAFQYEAIQLIEGYWGPRRLPTTVAERLARRHLRRRDDLQRQEDDALDRAWGLARTRMLQAEISEDAVNTVEKLVTRQSVRSPSPEARRLATAWLDFTTREERRHIDALAAALEGYPRKGHLIQPTRFGNTMRAYEERVHGLRGGAPLERFVQTVWHELPAHVQRAHGQLRARLDLYCTLLVVFMVSGVVAIVAFIDLHDRDTTLLGVTAVLTLVGPWLAYRAAITSARAYGTILTTIAEVAPRPTGAIRAGAPVPARDSADTPAAPAES